MPSSVPAVQMTRRQWGIVLLIGAVQFVNILDFVIVMPLGPDFATALGIPESHLGYVGGAYTAAACVSGLIGSLFLDRFDRRKALAVTMLGLVVGTASASFAVDLPTLLMARVVAGAFGGPATSISFSIISDAIPNSLRGRAMGTVMGAFSIASVLGVPTGLWLAEAFNWQAPFIGVAAVGLVVAAAAIFALPPMTGHLEGEKKKVDVLALVSDPLVQMSFLMTAIVMMAGFVIIPNIAAYLQLNLGFPRSALKWAYGVGGVASLLATQLGGRAVDRFGSFRVGSVGALMVVGVVFGFFYLPHDRGLPMWIVLWVFIGFMISNGLRNVSYNTLTTKVPAPEVRARFQSLQSATQHGASALAAMLSAQILTTTELPTRRLEHMDTVALVSITLSLIIPLLLFLVERGVKRRALTPGPLGAVGSGAG
ncbi:MAG: MFS transporter [Archangium sp.]|nr:MFS transporter [Archangium sp.]MDP3575801.1 MFS transporter [Archangium sp.]